MNCHEDLYTLDKNRYGTDKMSGFQKYWRLTNAGGGYCVHGMEYFFCWSVISEIWTGG